MDGLISALAAERRRLGRALDALGLLETAVEAVSVLGHRISVSRDGAALLIRVEMVGLAPDHEMPAQEAAAEAIPVDTARPASSELAGSRAIDLVATGPWTREEVELAWDMAQNGATNAEIGRALGRSAAGVGPAMHAKRRRREKAAPAEAAPAEAAPAEAAPAEAAPDDLLPKPQPKPAPHPALQVAPTYHQARTEWQRHVASLPMTAGWSVQDDLRLAEIIIRGGGLAAAVEALRREKDWLLERWRLLNRRQTPTIDGQAHLIAALKSRCAE